MFRVSVARASLKRSYSARAAFGEKPIIAMDELTQPGGADLEELPPVHLYEFPPWLFWSMSLKAREGNCF